MISHIYDWAAYVFPKRQTVSFRVGIVSIRLERNQFSLSLECCLILATGCSEAHQSYPNDEGFAFYSKEETRYDDCLHMPSDDNDAYICFMKTCIKFTKIRLLISGFEIHKRWDYVAVALRSSDFMHMAGLRVLIAVTRGSLQGEHNLNILKIVMDESGRKLRSRIFHICLHADMCNYTMFSCLKELESNKIERTICFLNIMRWFAGGDCR